MDLFIKLRYCICRYFRFDTGEQDLPRNKRPKQMEFDCLIAELR